MMLKRLNGWQRIGVVVSVAWLLWTAYDVLDARDRAGRAVYNLNYDQCIEDVRLQKRPPDRGCHEVAWAARLSVMSSPWPEIGVRGIGGVVLGWTVAYGVLWLIRWVVVGFRKGEADA